MIKASWRMILTLITVWLIGVSAVAAQEPRPTPTNEPPPVEEGSEDVRGSIRGNVRLDANGDGVCIGEAAQPGIPIEFVSNDGETSVFLQSGADGSYGLVAAGLGTWQVTARPGAEFVVTSQNPRSAFIGEDQRLALGIDFCVAKAGTVAPVTVLPAAGASPGAGLLVLALVLAGTLLLAAGAIREGWARRR